MVTEETDVLFIAGCEENQVRFHAQFDHIILLSAPAGTMMQRLASRTSNPYGKSPPSSAVSLKTPRPSSPGCGRQLTTRSRQQCRWTMW